MSILTEQAAYEHYNGAILFFQHENNRRNEQIKKIISNFIEHKRTNLTGFIRQQTGLICQRTGLIRKRIKPVRRWIKPVRQRIKVVHLVLIFV